MTARTPALSATWLAQRRALHRAYLAVAGGVDTSRLAYLGENRRRYSHEEVAALWSLQATRPYAQPAANHLYVHVPFCKSICSFCNYERLKPGNTDTMERWLARVLESVEVLGPSVRGLEFHNLYLGGGTPSVLTAEMLDKLFTALHQHFAFHPHALRHFEFDPAAMSAAKIDVLRRFGFANFSFGVQTLRADVNADHHRGHQDRELVQRRLDELAPFSSSVNCDFLLGLAGTEPEAMYQEIEDVLRMPNAPRNLDIFVMVPSPGYVDSHFGGERDAFEAHVNRFRESAPKRLAEVAAATGYLFEGGGAHIFRLWRTDAGTGASASARVPVYTQYTHLQGAPLNLLGLGTSARSHLFGAAQFVYEDPLQDVTAEGAGYFVGRTMTLAEEARVFVIMRMRDHHALDFAEFEAIFGTRMDALLPEVMAALELEGAAERSAKRLSLRRSGASTLLSDLLWVVSSEALEREVARYLGVLVSAANLGVYTQVPDGTLVEGFRVRHEEGATCFDGREGGLRVRWAPVLEDRASLEARVESTLRTAPPGTLLSVVRVMQRRLDKALASRRSEPQRRLPVLGEGG